MTLVRILEPAAVPERKANELDVDVQRTAATKAFPQFGRLPLEIQRQIWWYCLPRRITPVWTSSGCPFDRRAIGLAPPLVSRVCHEARIVALESGGLHPGKKCGDDVWFDSSTDRVFFNYELPRNITDSLPRPLLSFGRDVSEVVMGLRYIEKNARVSFEMARNFTSKSQEPLLVAKEVLIHLPLDDRWWAKEFGSPAESPNVLVDIDDLETIRKVRRLLKRLRSSNSESVRLLGVHLHSPEETAQGYRLKVEDSWLVHAFRQAMTSQLQDIEAIAGSLPRFQMMYLFRCCQDRDHLKPVFKP